jgi:methylenetetrahydrofolate dehydrogenase (NADP+)/methenyltetrahydrofolate cyclohydrolase
MQIVSQKIDGNKINEEIAEELKNKFSDFKEKTGKEISLGILCVGDDKASHTFINVKKKFGEKVGIVVRIYLLDENVNLEEIKNKLTEIEKENDTAMIQLPLPEKLKIYTDQVLTYLQEEKDVDSLKENNQTFLPPIVFSFQKILEKCGLNIKNNSEIKVGIVGKGKVVGMPIKKFCLENNFQVVEIGRGEIEKAKGCDIVVSGVGNAKFIKKENIKENVILIDYGYAILNGKMCGDFDGDCYKKAGFYTTVPGGMGPVVVACLFLNVLKYLENKNE